MADICRLCLASIANPLNKLVSDEINDSHQTKMKLLMPEIDIYVTPTFVLCNLCSDLLNVAYSFKYDCLQVEEVIKKYLIQHETKLVNLQDVKDLKFQQDNSKENILTRNIKIEENYNEVEEIFEVPSIKNQLNINFICDKCQKTFSDNKIFENHKQECVFYKCNQCDKELLTEEELDKHYHSHTVSKTYQCDICSKSYVNFSNLKRHIHSSHSDKTPNICDICNKIYSSKEGLERHKYIHQDRERKFACKICNSTFFKQYQLKNHQLIHINGIHKCSVCARMFSLANNLKRHMINKHFGKSICDTCGLRCGSKSILVEHQRTHTGERPFSCEKCGKRFAQRSTLIGHIKLIHEDKKPYACDRCGKSFPLRSSLTKHMFTHKNELEKKFICSHDECNKTFWRNTDLLRHMRYHLDARIYKCSICDTTFIESSGLKRHMKVHTGEKPFECQTCHRHFNQKCNLHKHLISHMPVKNFKK